jgi:hypothetical protein
MSATTDQTQKILVEIGKNEAVFFVHQGIFSPNLTPCTIRRSDVDELAFAALINREPLAFVKMLFAELEHVASVNVKWQALRVTFDDVLEGEDARKYLKEAAQLIEMLLLADRLLWSSHSTHTYAKEGGSGVDRNIAYLDHPGSLFEGYTRQYRFSREFGFAMEAEIFAGYSYPDSGGYEWAALKRALAGTGAVRSVKVSGRDVWIVANREHERSACHEVVTEALKQLIGERVKLELYCPEHQSMIW